MARVLVGILLGTGLLTASVSTATADSPTPRFTLRSGLLADTSRVARPVEPWHSALRRTLPVQRLRGGVGPYSPTRAIEGALDAARRRGAARTATEPVADPNLWGADGNVLGIARSGNTLYIAGSFRSVGENSGGFAPLDAATGDAIRPFPKVAGSVYTIVPDGAEGWYIGGEFSAVGGKPRSCLAQIRADGSITDWRPSVTGSPGYIDPPAVAAIAIRGNRIFVGGAFREVGGVPRENIGCVDSRTGAVLDWNPGTHVDGFVSALAMHDTTVFVGGAFSSVGGQPHSGLAAVDVMTGAVLPWRADATASVSALLVRGDTLFVGGQFQGIAGAYRPMLAAIDLSSAQLLPFDARASGIILDYVPYPQVAAMALVGDTLYVGGTFTQVGGQPRASLAALNASTGDALPWTPPDFGPVYSGFPPQICYALAAKDGTLYVGGSFETVGVASRPFAAALSRETGELTDWNPRPNRPIYAIAVSYDKMLAGGEFSQVGAWTHRAGLAAIDLGTGSVKPWNPNPDGGICTAVAVSGDRVFVSGDFSNIGGKPQARNRLAAIDTVDGEALDWNPGANSAADVLMMQGDTLYAGGEFTEVGGQSRNYLAALNATTGQVTGWDPNADWPVLTMAHAGGSIYVGGLFNQLGGQPRRGIAALDAVTAALEPWNPDTDNSTVDALLVSGNKIYVGGAFGQIGGQERRSVAALDLTTGTATDWNPVLTNWDVVYPRVRSLALADSVLFIGGSFGSISGQQRTCLGAVDTVSGLTTDWDPGTDGLVWSLAADGNSVYVGGGFTRAGGLPVSGLVAFMIPEEPAPAPVPFALAQSFPNPAHSSAVIRFALPAAAPVTFSVYDVQGRRVAMPLDHVVQQAGRHDVPVQAGLWKAGVYFYRLEAGGRSATRKMLVVK